MIRPFEHGGNIYRHTGDRPVLDYSANINPLGLAGGVRAAIAAHLDDVVHYPDPDCTALREALSRFYRIPADAIIPGNGAASHQNLVSSFSVSIISPSISNITPLSIFITPFQLGICYYITLLTSFQ